MTVRTETLSMGVNEQAQTLLDVLDRLAALLQDEVAAVKSRRPGRLAALFEAKERLALSYAEQLRAWLSGPAASGGVEFGLADRLRRAAGRFRELLEANARALAVAKSAHEKLIKAISDAVADEARPTLAYSKSGRYPPPQGQRGGGAAPIALDREV